MARIMLPSGTPAEMVRPQPDSRDLGLVIVPDIGGLRPLFDDLVARLSSEQGWPVVAIEPFPGRTFAEGDLDARHKVVPQLDDARILGDAVDAARVLDTATVGCIGFCMGGMYALKAASTGAFSRICSFYGMVRIPENWRGPGQGEPLDHISRAPASTKIMFVIGGRDDFTPPDDVEAVRSAGVDVAFYPEAEHGFVHDPSRPTHRAGDAADAWSRAVPFLRSR